jgi:cell division protease FtsH
MRRHERQMRQMRQVRRVGLRVSRGRGALEDMDNLDTLPANDELTDTAEQNAWIAAHRVYSVAFRLDDLTGLIRAKRAITALAYGLLHPDEVRAAGGSVPSAVLLSGPVGCGKTSLARALAGLIAEHSIFLEFVASELTPAHVAALARFAASGTTPVVVFIDELSWLGVERSSRRHDAESRAALYAVLAAVSGVRDPARAPILWLGATSEDPDDLDPALTRAGRFSHVIEVRQPDTGTRQAHLERLLAARRVGSPIALDPIVEMTAGLSFADLDQVADDALALALTDGGPDAGITQAHLGEAIAARGRSDDAPDRTPAERWRAAVHEGGHGLVAAVVLPGGLDAVRSMSVSPRAAGHQGGHTTIGQSADEGAARALADGELLARVAVHLAGAVAERLLVGEASTGSADDARRAGQMVLERLDAGIDPAWPAAWPTWTNMGPAAEDRRAASVYATLADCRATAEGILGAHRAGLERLARRLYAEGDLADTALRDALADVLAADTLVTAS